MTAPSVLYIASASVTDPLIVSQVIRYLEQMRPSLTACHLITFERDGSRDSSPIAQELMAAGITWHPIQAWSRLRSVASGLIDVVLLPVLAVSLPAKKLTLFTAEVFWLARLAES